LFRAGTQVIWKTQQNCSRPCLISVDEPSKAVPTREEEENKRNDEVEGSKSSEIKKKRGRPSEKDKEGLTDKEGLPVSKKAKKSPRNRKNLKTKAINISEKTNGFSKLYKNKHMEKCVFCQEEHFRETLWEGVGQEKPDIFQIPICKGCHACLKDARIIKEIREVIEKSSSKLNEGGEKVEYFCGMCRFKIHKNHPTILCNL